MDSDGRFAHTSNVVTARGTCCVALLIANVLPASCMGFRVLEVAPASIESTHLLKTPCEGVRGTLLSRRQPGFHVPLSGTILGKRLLSIASECGQTIFCKPCRHRRRAMAGALQGSIRSSASWRQRSETGGSAISMRIRKGSFVLAFRLRGYEPAIDWSPFRNWPA
jgi:hypothetical protein